MTKGPRLSRPASSARMKRAYCAGEAARAASSARGNAGGAGPCSDERGSRPHNPHRPLCAHTMGGAGQSADRAGEGVVEPEAAVAQAAAPARGRLEPQPAPLCSANTARGRGLEVGGVPPVVPAWGGLDARGPEDAVLHQVVPLRGAGDRRF
jgi:hypothetical protein